MSNGESWVARTPKHRCPKGCGAWVYATYLGLRDYSTEAPHVCTPAPARSEAAGGEEPRLANVCVYCGCDLDGGSMVGSCEHVSVRERDAAWRKKWAAAIDQSGANALRAGEAEQEAASLRQQQGIATMPTRVDQLPNGCWAACVATITGIPLGELDQQIPPNASEEWFHEHATALHNDMVQKLRARNWRLDYHWRDVPHGFAIASGKSPRLETVQHAVVIKNGLLWHDPHPSRAGLRTVESIEVLTPFLHTIDAGADGVVLTTIAALDAGTPNEETRHE